MNPRQIQEALSSENCIISSIPRPKAFYIKRPFFLTSGKICISYLQNEIDDDKTNCIKGGNVQEIWNPDDGKQKIIPEFVTRLYSLMDPDQQDCADDKEEKAFHKSSELQHFHECFTYQFQQDYLHCSDFLTPLEIVTVKHPEIKVTNTDGSKKYGGMLKETRIEFYQKQQSEYKLTSFIPSEKKPHPVTVAVLSPNKFITATLSNQFQVWERKDATSEFKKIDSFDLFKQTWPRCKLGSFSNDVDAHCYKTFNRPQKPGRNFPINPHVAHLYALSSTEVLYLQCRSMSDDFQLFQKIDIVNKKVVNQLFLDPTYRYGFEINTSMVQLTDGKTFFCFYSDNVRTLNRILDTETMSLYSLPSNCNAEPYSNQLSKTGAILSANQREHNCELYLFPHIAVYNNNVQLEIALHVTAIFHRYISKIIAEYVGGHDVIVNEKDKVRLSANLFSLYGAPIATSQGLDVMNSSEFGCKVNFKDQCRKAFSLI